MVAAFKSQTMYAYDRIWQRDGGKVGAFKERAIADRSDARGERDGCQAGTITEGSIADMSNTGGDGDGIEADTKGESPLPDIGNTGWECDGSKAGTATESRIADRIEAVGEVDRNKTEAIFKSIIGNVSKIRRESDRSESITVFKDRSAESGVAATNHDRVETRAVGESITAKGGDTRWDGNRSQASVGKSLIAYRSKTAGQRNIRKTATGFEGRAADGGKGIGQKDRIELITLRKSMIVNHFDCGRNGYGRKKIMTVKSTDANGGDGISLARIGDTVRYDEVSGVVGVVISRMCYYGLTTDEVIIEEMAAGRDAAEIVCPGGKGTQQEG